MTASRTSTTSTCPPSSNWPWSSRTARSPSTSAPSFRIQPDVAAFESVYLRPTNGRHAGAPSPRDRRAIQYFAYPGWRFELLRTTYPDVYETGADIDLDRWTTLRLEVDADRLDAYVDDVLTLAVDPTLLPPRRGRIGLFVDIGTVAWFSNLQVSHAVT